jgi:hypothetical protein
MLDTHQGYARHAHERTRVPDDLYARSGFASTAVYFEILAQKEARDHDRRNRLLEVARFYHSLAGIIPGMPEGYKNEKVLLGCEPSPPRDAFSGRAFLCPARGSRHAARLVRGDNGDVRSILRSGTNNALRDIEELLSSGDSRN